MHSLTLLFFFLEPSPLVTMKMEDVLNVFNLYFHNVEIYARNYFCLHELVVKP